MTAVVAGEMLRRAAVRVAPFALARIGGLPASAAESLVLHQTLQDLRALLAVEEELRATAPAIEDILYRLVARLEEDAVLRRRALGLKRDVHNLRTARAQELLALEEALDDVLERQQVRRWALRAAEREEARAAAEARCDAELIHAGASLAGWLKDPILQRGLALASPDLLREVLETADPGAWHPAAKRARSGAGYLARTALKTSPFSTLSQVGLVDLGSAEPDGPAHNDHGTPGDARSLVSLARTLIHALLDAVARSAELAGALCYEPNHGIRRAPGLPGLWVVPRLEYLGAERFPWRYERETRVRFDAERASELIAALESGERLPYARWLAILAPHSNGGAHDAFVRLLDGQLVRPVAPYSRRDPQPLLALAAVLEQTGTEGGRLVAARLRRMEGLAAAVGHAEGRDRVVRVGQIRSEAGETFALLGSNAPAWLTKAGVVYEDVTTPVGSVALPAVVREDLTLLAEELRPRLFRAKIHDYLIEYFLARFGPRGEVSDVLRFLREFLDRPESAELRSRAVVEDYLRARGSDGGRTHGGAPPALTVLFQLACSSQEALARGEYKLVVNQILPGPGALLNRFAGALSDRPPGLAPLLREWLQALHPDSRLLGVPIMAEWNNLQAEQGVLPESLRWYAEAPANEDRPAVKACDLRLRLDVSQKRFLLADREGRPVAPVYLGTIPPPFLSDPALRLFLRLLDPWVVDPEIGRPTTLVADQRPPNEVEFHPRVERGRLVLRRAYWRVPIPDVPWRRPGEAAFDLLSRVERWRLERGLPEAVFASVERKGFSLEPKERKPFWLHFGSPHALEAAQALIGSDAQALLLSEALPGRGEHWLVSAASARAAELVALVAWPGPPAERAPEDAGPLGFRAHRRPGRSRLRDGDAHADRWLYVKVYTARPEQLDDAIRAVVAPARDLARARAPRAAWFFLRFADARGPHVRLRFEVPVPARDGLLAGIRELAERALPGCGVEPARYEPELEKYAGVLGVRMAERRFQLSSDVVLEALSLEARRGLSRIAAAHDHMRRLVWRTHPVRADRRRFLHAYAGYWQGPHSQEPSALDIPGSPADALDALSEAYEAGVARCERRERRYAQQLESPPTLAFDYLHLHNNRLGLTATQEAALARRLLEDDA